MLTIVMLSAIYPNQGNKPLMLYVVILCVIATNKQAPNP